MQLGTHLIVPAHVVAVCFPLMVNFSCLLYQERSVAWKLFNCDTTPSPNASTSPIFVVSSSTS